MLWRSLLLSGALFAVWYVATGQDSPEGYRIARDASYFILAPSKIRPNQVFQMSVSILNMYYETIDVRAIVRRNREEIAQSQSTFYMAGTQMMQIEIPEYAGSEAADANFTLRVEGSSNGGVGGYIFENETYLIFDSKQLSLFIQPDKPLYRQGQTVRFRVMPVEKTLMSRSGSMDIYIEGPTGTTVRRWLSMQTNAGVLDMAFQLTEQPDYGVWKIVVNAWGHWYSKDFVVNEYWITALDVNVSAPLYVIDDDYGVAGIVTTNLTMGQAAKGTCKVKLEIRDPLNDQEPGKEWPTIEQETRYFPGFIDFKFTMEEIRRAIDKNTAANKELYIEATVYDWFLAQEASGFTITIIYSNSVDVRLLGDQSRTFKPGVPMDVYYAVVHKDGTPLSRWRRQIEITGTETTASGSHNIKYKMLVPDDGVVHYRYTPKPDSTSIRMRASYDEMTTASEEMVAWRHFSPTDSYLSITTSTLQPQVDQHMVFTVRSNRFVEDVTYLLTSGGNILTVSTLEVFGYQKTFSVATSREMIPEAHIIVWYVFEGEVISDSLNYFVNGTRLNPVRMALNRGKDFTGDSAELNAWTDPSSFIGFNALDYELWAYGWNPFITETDIIDEMQTYDEHVNTSFSHTWKLPEEQTQVVHYPSPCYAIDANKTFEYSGLVVFTDANVTRLPHMCNETMGEFPCKDGQLCYTIAETCDGFPQCQDYQDEMGCPRNVSEPFTPPRDRLGLLARHYYMVGDWIWNGHFVMPNGRLDLLTEVPDEPMAWVVDAFAISKDLGFGILQHPLHYEATRAFYMRTEGPSHAVKGEQIGIKISLYNYWNQDLECILLLHDSDDYRFVVVEEFGIVSSYNPRTVRGDIQIMVYLQMGHVYEIQMPILPTIQGCISVTITADAYIYADSETMEICTKFDGVTNYLHTPYFIDLINKGSMVLPDLEIPVPERFVMPEERLHLYVPGSPECYVGIVGDVVGPGLFAEWLNAEVTLRKPVGSAEENMFSFGYIVYNLIYQKETDQLKQSTLNTSLDHLNTLLQRQMGYMNDDGSFSMFRDYQQHTPSTWVTAYVLRTLQDSHQRDWEYKYYLNTNTLNRLALWLCSQQTPSGIFVERAPLYDQKMMGNYTLNGHQFGHNITMTAYVALALKTASSLTGEAKACAESSSNRARTYLEQRLDQLKDPFELSLTTFALHVLESTESTKAFEIFNAMRFETEYVYWADKPVPENDVKWVDNIPYHQPRRWYDNEAYAVEATAYGLLTYMRKNYLVDSFPIMKWLQTMRNTYAGQAGTHDSLTALIALVEYAKRDTNRALYNIEVLVQATSMGNFTQRVHLTRDNWAELQQVKIDPVWGSVRGQAQGTGMALMQLSTYVNVEYPHQIEPVAEGKYYDVEVAAFNYSGRNYSIMEIMPCARWARPDISNRSGMAVLEVHVPTGYFITNDVLRAYTQSGEVPTLRRSEQYGRKLIFFFDYLESSQKTCVRVRLDRWYPAANMTIQHTLRVFDYYEPGRHNTTLYNTWFLYDLHLCQVCASFQCPYCPFYNAAPPPVHTNLALSVLAALTAILMTSYFSSLLGTG